MKVALVHDQLREFGGAERVLVSMKSLFPNADVFSTTADLSLMGAHKPLFDGWKIRVSWFGKIPFVNAYYSPFRFLTPLIWESFDFTNYDLVISSSGSWMSKGIKTKSPTVHISYVHHPPRYLYGYETAIEWQKYWPVRVYAFVVNHFLRLWDFQSSQRPDYLIANSKECQKRIKKFYRRDSTVIYPPVRIAKSPPDYKKIETKRGRDHFVTVSRLAKAKHIDILIKAANKEGFHLTIIGRGRDEAYLKSISGPTVTILNRVTDRELARHYETARAFLFASRDEEFGIAPVEAMGAGLPVIAFRSGGIPEFVAEGKNGYLYEELTADSLIEKIRLIRTLPDSDYGIMCRQARKTAEKFSEKNFKNNLLKFVTAHLGRK